MTELLKLSEREKYTRMFAIPDYSLFSPGERNWKLFQEMAIAQYGVPFTGGTIVDIGSGSGQVFPLMAGDGNTVLGFDLLYAVRPEFGRYWKTFFQGCLWDWEDVAPLTDWDPEMFYCCDVMEHLPESMVDEALDNLSYLTHQGFFSISTIDDNFGNLIGEKLHQTVRPAEWWMEKLEKCFTLDQVAVRDNELICLVSLRDATKWGKDDKMPVSD